MNTGSARDILLTEKFNLQDSIRKLVDEFESKTGLLVDKLGIVRNNMGYADKKLLIGIDATIII